MILYHLLVTLLLLGIQEKFCKKQKHREPQPNKDNSEYNHNAHPCISTTPGIRHYTLRHKF